MVKVLGLRFMAVMIEEKTATPDSRGFQTNAPTKRLPGEKCSGALAIWTAAGTFFPYGPVLGHQAAFATIGRRAWRKTDFILKPTSQKLDQLHTIPALAFHLDTKGQPHEREELFLLLSQS